MKSKEYIKEYTKQNGIDDLERILSRVQCLLTICSNRSPMDEETKQHIIELYETSKLITDIETSKELKKQIAEGKEFLSHDEIDKIFDDAFND